MCTVLTQNDWINEAADPTSPYRLLGEYTNARGERAIMIAAAEQTVANVYDAAGTDMEVFLYDFNTAHWLDTYHEQVIAAEKAMVARGFTQRKGTARQPGIAELSTAQAQATYDQQLATTEEDEEAVLATI